MSASVSAMRGGQPSTTQPIAAPWLSPKVVTRKRWPKVLNDIGFHPPACGSPRAGRGQMGRSAIAGERCARKHIDHALVDGIMRGILGRGELEMGDERAGGDAMGGDHGVPIDSLVPFADASGHLRIAFAAGRRKTPFVGFAPGNDILVACHHVGIGQAFPFAERDLGKPQVDGISAGRKTECRAHDLHGLARPYQRTRHIVEALRRTPVAAKQILQDVRAANRLRATLRVEGYVVVPLQPLLCVPIREAVTNVIDDGRRHGYLFRVEGPRIYSLPTTMSGASGCFIPTTW